MFDTNKVAKNIKNARTKLNMTQMNLADEMGVSYQVLQGAVLMQRKLTTRLISVLPAGWIWKNWMKMR